MVRLALAIQLDSTSLSTLLSRFGGVRRTIPLASKSLFRLRPLVPSVAEPFFPSYPADRSYPLS